MGLKPESINQSLAKFVSSIFTSNGLSVCAQRIIKKSRIERFNKNRFFLNEKKESGRLTQIHVVRNASRGVLRLSPGLIKLGEESTHAGHRCMSSGDQQSFIRGGSAQRSKPLFTIFDKKGTLPFTSYCRQMLPVSHT